MATATGTTHRMLIGGEWVGSDGGEFDVTNPASGETVGTVPNATADDVTRAIDAAEAALPGWRAKTAVERGNLLRKAAALIRERVDEIGGTMTDEQGKPLAEAIGEVAYAASFFEWFAGRGRARLRQTLPAIVAGQARPRAAPAGRRRRPRSRPGTSRPR